MDHLPDIIGIGGGSAGLATTIWNFITSKNNKEMLAKQEKKIEKVTTDLADHKEKVAKEYVTAKRFENMEGKIDRIYEHLIESK